MKTITESGPELSNFRGIDNVDPFHKFPKRKGTFLQLAINCDIDDTGQIIRAGGIKRIISGSSRDIWADSTQRICLFIKDGQLKKLNEDESETPLGSIDSNSRTDFCEVLDKIFYSNGLVIGYYKEGSLHSIPAIDQEFKHPMKPGHLLEWFESRLYVARDNIMTFSDATVPMYYDSRTYRTIFRDRITMMKSVDDGMYLSTLGDGTFFLAGKDPSEFKAIKLTDTYAYFGSAITVEGEDFTGQEKAGIGRVVLWTSSEGVYMGMPGGRVKNLTGNYYMPVEDIQSGGALYRDDLEYNQYIFCYNFQNINRGGVKIPPLRIRGYGSIS